MVVLLGGAICGSLVGILGGAVLGAVYGAVRGNVSWGLDGAIFGGLALALVGAAYGLTLGARGETHSAWKESKEPASDQHAPDRVVPTRPRGDRPLPQSEHVWPKGG